MDQALCDRCRSEPAVTPRSIILDCDPGHDDALALLLALARPEVRLLAVTTVAGNAPLAQTTRNALRVLTLLGRTDIPVAAGADRPLDGVLRSAPEVHGTSGLDGADLPEPAADVVGANALELTSSLLEAQDLVTIVVTGPLTNLARLITARPDLLPRIEAIVLMGGAIGEGNWTASAEFNIWADPEAAEQVFATSFKDATVVGLDVTEQVALDRSVWETAASRTSEAATLIDQVCRRSFVERGEGEFFLHDPVALGLVFDPSFAEAEPAAIKVVLSGEEEGRTNVAGHGAWQLATRPDRDRFVAMFEGRTGLR